MVTLECDIHSGIVSAATIGVGLREWDGGDRATYKISQLYDSIL